MKKVNMSLATDHGLSTKQTVLIVGGIIIVTFSIVPVSYYQLIDVSTARLLMDAILTIATFGYVLLTYNMVSQMKKDNEIRQRRQNRPRVIKRLETDVIPLLNDIRYIRTTLRNGESEWNGPDQVAIGGEVYRCYHEIDPEYSIQSIPRFTMHIDLDNATTHEVYRLVQEYSEAYRRAIHQLQGLILEKTDVAQGDSDQLRDLAVLALKVEDGETRETEWDLVKEEIVPLRDEIPDFIDVLQDTRNELNAACGEALKELDAEINNTMKQYRISESELDPETLSQITHSSNENGFKPTEFAKPVDQEDGVVSEKTE